MASLHIHVSFHRQGGHENAQAVEDGVEVDKRRPRLCVNVELLLEVASKVDLDREGTDQLGDVPPLALGTQGVEGVVKRPRNVQDGVDEDGVVRGRRLGGPKVPEDVLVDFHFLGGLEDIQEAHQMIGGEHRRAELPGALHQDHDQMLQISDGLRIVHVVVKAVTRRHDLPNVAPE
eukprot:scaffold1245_cov252-Pinguiococcus_pyrenoidosus.AAC.7